MIDLADMGLHVEGEPMGEGGSAVVYKGTTTASNVLRLPEDTKVAVKEFKPTILLVPNQLARIRQEADVGLRIPHPNLAAVYALVERRAATLLILEWIEGHTLEAWVQKQRKDVAWTRVQSIALDIVSGLAALHAENVYHRDVKPENVMVRPDGRAVLMDIGVAEIADDNEHTLHTELKDFLGSVRYASPQFILGEPFQPSDDVYSLGLTLLYLFSGVRPYEKIQRKPVLPIRVVEGPPSIDRLRKNIPKPMKILLQACVHRDRNRRPDLAAVAESIQDPDGSQFLTRELDRQAAEGRAYQVVRVMDSGATFYADLVGEEPELEREYTVVRTDTSVMVPSYNREVATERWIANAVLKHSHQNVGFFKVIGRRWEEPRSSLSQLTGMIDGHWVEHEKVTDKVQVGDLVLKESGHTDFV